VAAEVEALETVMGLAEVVVEVQKMVLMALLMWEATVEVEQVVLLVEVL
jgi:hypothetical protein